MTLRAMKPFEKIYDIVSKIPKGKVMTYGQVAKKAGIHNARIVGFAMNGNKDLKRVPCHRVVGSDGNLKGYAMGGIEIKKQKLLKEGVTFKTQELVDMHVSKLSFLKS